MLLTRIRLCLICGVISSGIVRAKQDCIYNSLQGFCVETDANRHSPECRARDGWLQFSPVEPWPRVYSGCGDDGIVSIHSSAGLIRSMHVVFIKIAEPRIQSLVMRSVVVRLATVIVKTIGWKTRACVRIFLQVLPSFARLIDTDVYCCHLN